MLGSEAIAAARREDSLKAWRAVEAQHVVSTLRLTRNDPDRQQLLELILEESKPAVPRIAQGMHYLLSTPFRYPPSQHGSRFRAWPDAGVLYGAFERRTACVEMGYWRWRFAQDSEGLGEIPASAQTVFRFGAEGKGINLTEPPFVEFALDWTRPDDYAPTQALARRAREVAADWIQYVSVRDPEPGLCLAVLNANALHPKRLLEQETWFLTITHKGAIWQRDRQRFVFTFAQIPAGSSPANTPPSAARSKP